VLLALVAGGVSAVGAIATGEQFHETSRASGLGLGYTLATVIFGGLTPTWRNCCSSAPARRPFPA